MDYAIPVVLFEVAGDPLMLLVNRMNWQCYFMYQIAVTFLSFVPLVFLKIGWTKHPMLTVISVVISVSALVLTILLGDRSVKKRTAPAVSCLRKNRAKEQFQKHAE